MLTAKVFQSGNSQAVRIPKELQTIHEELIIKKLGEGFIMYPVDDPWYPLRLSIGKLSADFMPDREQPSWDDVTEREAL